MKIALALITVPFIISFMSGMFDWYVEDGMFALFGLAMIVGLGWAWFIELKGKKTEVKNEVI
jgi:membrane protein CcdC involved in cytochrome C biogenesis